MQEGLGTSEDYRATGGVARISIANRAIVGHGKTPTIRKHHGKSIAKGGGPGDVNVEGNLKRLWVLGLS